MMNNKHFSRIDTLELKAGVVRRIGHQKAERYFNQLGRLLTSKVSKKDFSKYCSRILGKENMHLHNQLIGAILKNAHVAEVPPLKGSSFARLKNGRFRNSTRRNVLGPVNGSVEARDVSDPLEVLKEKERQSATELCSLGSRPPVEVASVEDGEEVEQRAASPCIQSRSPVTAPLGISVKVCGARKTLLNGSEKKYEHETCQNSGQLPDTESLKKRLACSLEKVGVDISTDCANLLNNSLDVYIKRLIEPCLEIAATRIPTQHVGRRERPPLNGLIPTVHGGMQAVPRSFCASMTDFITCLEMNPPVLGGEWALQLEKIRSHVWGA
uniref:Transcriptional coactivator Hfi1/Transcriptional adapter 1 n=1 Tax=Kalanchoe fedtschenkoi TaxID=63787 RepID=A0A7N0T4U2_KALFE